MIDLAQIEVKAKEVCHAFNPSLVVNVRESVDDPGCICVRVFGVEETDKKPVRDIIYELEEALFALLANRRFPPPEKLPSTGIDKDWEKVLSPIFIKSPNYGTRSSTILLIGKNLRVTFIEKVYNGRPQPWLVSRFNFILDK